MQKIKNKKGERKVMKKFKVFALVFAIMLSATGLGLLFGSNQPASTQAKVSADETASVPGIYTVDSNGAKTMTKSWGVIATKNGNSLTVSLEKSDGTYLVCGELPAGVTSLDYAFFNKGWLTNIIFTDSFNTSNVTNMSFMFSGCSSLTSLDLSNFDTSNVTDMGNMFSGCTSLQNIKMPNIMNAESDITLSALSLPSQNASGTAIKWYSLGNGETGANAVVADNKVSSYATKILTIDVNKDKSYAEIDNIIANATKPSTPETPSTGVVLDVVLPVASIVLVLASLVAVAFVGKKKKQY